MAGLSGVWKAGWLVAALGALLAAPPAKAEPGEAPAYAEGAKTVIAQLLAGRDFKPGGGCGPAAPCAALLARLKAGDFAVVAPDERSDKPDLPSYLSLRKHCPNLDPVRVTLAHHTFAATRNFAAYRLELPRQKRRNEEILVFRAQHYTALHPDRSAAVAADDSALLPGTFAAISPSGCRLLATVPTEDGDWFAKHNAIADGDHASELLLLDGRYVVLNIMPIAAPHQPKSSWWYTLELRELGLPADKGPRHQRPVYSFGYRPDAEVPDAGHAAQARAAPG